MAEQNSLHDLALTIYAYLGPSLGNYSIPVLVKLTRHLLDKT